MRSELSGGLSDSPGDPWLVLWDDGERFEVFTGSRTFVLERSPAARTFYLAEDDRNPIANVGGVQLGRLV